MVPLEEVDRLEFAGPIPEPVEHVADALKASGVKLSPEEEAKIRAEWSKDAAASVSAYTGQYTIMGKKNPQ